jgi:hypothetical protein
MSSAAGLLAESDALHTRVRAFARGASADDFESLALAIARFQARHSPGFSRLVGQAPLDRVEQIPSVPADAFRLTRVAVHAPEHDAARFVTSGTTGSERGTHPFRTTDTYAELSLAFGRRALTSHGRRPTVVALADRPGERPSSSLGFMIDHFARSLDGRALGGGPFQPSAPDRYLLRASGIDLASLRRAASIAHERGEPLLVLATAFALVALIDALGGARLPLPEGSAVMQTGGYKGRSRELDPVVLRSSVAESFEIPGNSVVAEYGMTELSSQLYEGTLEGAELRAPPWTLLEPPWLRVVPVDPETLSPVAHGNVGLARFIDLANIDSAVAILTRDLVRRNERGIELLGRAPGALPRGCSLAVEALLESGRER